MNIFWMFRIQISSGKGSLGFSQPAWVVIVVKKPCIYLKSFLFDHLFMGSDYGLSDYDVYLVVGINKENDQIAKNWAGYPTCYHVSIQQSHVSARCGELITSVLYFIWAIVLYDIISQNIYTTVTYRGSREDIPLEVLRTLNARFRFLLLNQK